ncbi:MAG TPA: hypothetical protein PKB06_06200, partial [Actinotalea sp.]|nr:hypothetical protein [Actinotalea sp.]
MSVLSDLREVAVHAGFRRLLAVRLVSQTGDGAFQAGLATLFFFSPERLATAGDVAAAFAVLLLPFTVVGPWAGVLLDRWRRRQVLLVGNAVRVGLTLALAALMAGVGVGLAVYVVALATLSVNRFLLAALSAGLPNVVPREQLIMANTISPNLGAAAAGVGASLGIVGGLGAPEGPLRDAVVLVGAAVLFGTASALALRLGPDQLGPARRAGGSELWRHARRIGRGLVDGVRHLWQRRTPAYALGVIVVHRFVYGTITLVGILMSRNLLADPTDAQAGLAVFAVLGIGIVAGFVLGVLVTPFATQWLSAPTWMAVSLGVAALGQVALLVRPSLPALVVAGVLLAAGSQAGKIRPRPRVRRLRRALQRLVRRRCRPGCAGPAGHGLLTRGLRRSRDAVRARCGRGHHRVRAPPGWRWRSARPDLSRSRYAWRTSGSPPRLRDVTEIDLGDGAPPELPALLADRPAATLLIDVSAGTVVYANTLAVSLAPGVRLPVSAGEWARAARLQDADGSLLEDGPLQLLDIARGTPSRGVELTAMRASSASAPREALWAVGIALDDAPPPLAHQSLVVLLPRRDAGSVRAFSDLGSDLYARAAAASDLSFTISDPHQP